MPSNTASKRPHGKGSLELHKGIYIARWQVGKKRYSKSTQTGDKAKAQEKLDEYMLPYRHGVEIELLEAELKKAKGETDKIEKRQDPLSTAFDLYLNAANRPDAGETTLSGYKTQFDAFVSWMKQNHPKVTFLQDVADEHAQGFMQHLGMSLSANSYNKYATFLKCLWRTLRQSCKLTVNPWDDIRHKRLNSHSRRELTIDELQNVLEAANGELKVLFTIGIYTGLRLGDCALLDWSCIDLKQGLIKLVPRKTARHANGKITVIPIHGALATVLERFPITNRNGYVLPDTASAYRRNPSLLSNRIQKHFRDCGIQTGGKTARLYKKRGTYRFELQKRDEKGHHIVEDTKLTDLAAARALFAKRFGTVKRDHVDVGFHSLRHTWVSLAANSGAPLALVQAIVGHSNPTMTRHYFHENVDALRSTVAKLPTISGNIVKAPAVSAPDFTFLNKYSKDELKAIREEINRRLQ